MSYKTRKTYYKELEKIRKRPIITYVTSIRPGCQAQMSQDVLPIFINQIDKIKGENKDIDLLIISNGGDPIVSWRIISLLREKFENISVLVPYTAYSAATLLALGADEIIMHSYGNLGPLDPQFVFPGPNNKMKSISYEEIKKYIEFVKEIGITDQELLQRSFEKLTDEIKPTSIGFAKRSSQLALTMSQKLLATHMKDENKTKQISETLNSKFYHHGYPLYRKEAIEIGLPIANHNEIIERLIWAIYEDFVEELDFNKVFKEDQAVVNKIQEVAKTKLFFPTSVNIKIKQNCLESSSLNCYNNLVISAQCNTDGNKIENINISSSLEDWVVEE
ncbi:MAG: hypothetical protein IAC58_05005 [Firmicutes bacterium]|uniref:Serine dehydrogenase proteinase n=1 Tax=Candidatus Onthovivens merdipullorum TaxID=2840889 RepID=A0A9D9DHQ4_9BACL|nr:hypothetical protein [Candidatus Onthovivens merdipullorum]